MRIGIGYDIHILAQERKLILGGVNIPFEMGLSGHSDADVLIHSLGDALLGAAGMEDLGHFFPDTDVQYKNISSLILLERIYFMLKKDNFRIINLDAVVLVDKPKLSPYVPQMKENLAKILEISPRQIGIKATTWEGFSPAKGKKGICCWAIANIEKMSLEQSNESENI